MKSADIVIKLCKKYDFQRALTDSLKRRILKSKKTIFSAVMKNNDITFVSIIAARIYTFFRSNGVNISLGSGVRLVYAAAAASFVVVMGISVFLFYPAKFNTPSVVATIKGTGSIIETAGDVSIERNGSLIAIKQRGEVTEGDSVITGKNSFIVVQLKDIGLVKIHDNSKVVFKSIDSAASTLISLESGSLFSKVKKRTISSAYLIETAHFTAAVRGTEFVVISDTVSGDVRVLEGKVNVTAQGRTNDVEMMNGVKVNNSGTTKSYSLSEIQKLNLKRDAQYNYIDSIDTLSDSDLNTLLKSVRDREKNVDGEIKQLRRDSVKNEPYVNPLDRLRKQGKALTMIHLNDGSQIAGAVVGSDESNLKLDTGEGTIAVPLSRIVRRVPIK